MPRSGVSETMTRLRDARAILIAGPTASGKSRACAAAGRAARRRRHQRRQHAGLPRAAHPHRAADARGGGAGAACALRLRQRRRGLFRRALCRRCGPRHRRGARARARAHHRRRHRALLQGAAGGALAGAGRSIPTCAPTGARRPRRGPRRELHADAGRARPGDGRAPDADRPQRIVRALEVLESTGRSLADWQREPGKPVLAEDETVRLLVLPDRATLGAEPSMRASTPCWRRARWRRCAACLRSACPTELPIMRALGVAPLAAHVAGKRRAGRRLWRGPRPRPGNTPSGSSLGSRAI